MEIERKGAPAGAAAPNAREVQFVIVDFNKAIKVLDGAFFFHVTPLINGMDLVHVHAEHITAGGASGTTDIQVRNVTDGVDMLSTVLTVDGGETGSDTAATPAVIDTDEDDVVENDLLRVDVKAKPSPTPKGLIVTLGFQTP